MKGVAVNVIIGIVLFVFLMLFLVGISGNYKPASAGIGDVIGAFFGAIAQTFGEFAVVTNTLLFATIFFAVEGIFIFVYVKIGLTIFKHIPEAQALLKQGQKWFNRY